MKRPELPFPIGVKILVFKDDGNWHRYRSWFLRTQKQIETLFVARVTLAHYEGLDEPDYDYQSWCRKASQLVAQYPGCVFVYASNACETK
jgi:hypothetical protein